MSNISNTKIYQKLEAAAIALNGDLSYAYQQVNGGMSTGGLYNFKIFKNWNGLELLITTSLDEIPLQNDEFDSCTINITAFKTSPNDIELSIWRKDYFDKLFGFKTYKTGYKEFDRVIAVKPSRNIERYTSKVFENQELRNELILDNYRTYNIHSKNGKIIIQRKSLLGLENKEMIIKEFKRFELFLNGLMGANII